MAKGILGTKVGMTQVFDEDGRLVPVTVVSCEPNVILQKKTVENDGYEAVQLGYKDKRPRSVKKAEAGHAAKSDSKPKRYVKEIAGNTFSNFDVGQEIGVNIFEAGEVVDVTGTSKGKGFQGVVKRHGHSTSAMTHGSRYHRGPGTLGPIDPNHVLKGMKLPGHMGAETVTIQNLKIVNVDEARNLLLISGNVPGPKRGLLVVKHAVKSDPVKPLDPAQYAQSPEQTDSEESAE